MKRRLTAAIFALSVLLTLGAQPGQELLGTETGRLALTYCLTETDRSQSECNAYAAEAETYALYTGQDTLFP